VDTLEVDLNRGEIHGIEVADSLTVSGPLSVRLENHGPPVHVHLRLDDSLSQVASLAGSNHYVEGETGREVDVDVVPADEETTGRLDVVTGHGNESASVEVTVEAGAASKPPVEVDESFESPPGSGSGAPSSSVFRDHSRLLAFLFVVFAVAVAILVGATIESPPVLLGTGVVVGAALAAVIVLLR